LACDAEVRRLVDVRVIELDEVRMSASSLTAFRHALYTFSAAA